MKYGEGAVRRTFAMLAALEDTNTPAKQPKGWSRLAASGNDRESWTTIMIRVATRASAGLEDPEPGVKSESGKAGNFHLANTIRESLYKYVISDWKRRLDTAVAWLNEEWYNDRLQHQHAAALDAAAAYAPRSNYTYWTLKVIDGILPYVEGTDQVIIRFMSEIPELDAQILSRVRKLAEDPERVALATKVLTYLHLLRPPVKSLVADCAQEIWMSSELPGALPACTQ